MAIQGSGLSRWFSGKESTYKAGNKRDTGSTPGRGNGNPLQDSCLGNLMGREAWQAIVHGVSESDMAEYVHTRILRSIPTLTREPKDFLLSNHCFSIRFCNTFKLKRGF